MCHRTPIDNLSPDHEELIILGMGAYLQAIFSVATKEHCLPPVVPDPIGPKPLLSRALSVAALGVTCAHTLLEILRCSQQKEKP